MNLLHALVILSSAAIIGMVLLADRSSQGKEVTQNQALRTNPSKHRKLFLTGLGIQNLVTESFCLKSTPILGGADYEEVVVGPLRYFWNLILQRPKGTCLPHCANLCKHEPCFSDYEVTLDGGACYCLTPDASDCGADSQCNEMSDTCECNTGFYGSPYSMGGCQADPNCEDCKAEFGERCPKIFFGNETCADGLGCARRSKTDSTNICCPRPGPCNQGFQCCDGWYKEGEPCPSKSGGDCEGDLKCAQRSRFDDTFVCCKQVFFPGILSSNPEVCRGNKDLGWLGPFYPGNPDKDP